jgi:hypothetical protein
MAQSPVRGVYDQALDRESAYEMLQQAAARAAEPEPQEQPARRGGWADDEASGQPAPRARSGGGQSMAEAFGKSLLRSVGSQLGRELMRGVLGGLAGPSRRRRRY